MTLPMYREQIDQALHDLTVEQATFTSRSRLIAHVSVLTGISTSTVYRYVRTVAVDRLIDADFHLKTTRDSPACPPVEQPPISPGQSTCDAEPLASAHVRPFSSPSSASSSPTGEVRPRVGGLSPSVGSQLKRMRNGRADVCRSCSCDVWAGGGWILLPYAGGSRAPVYCESCWAVLDATHDEVGELLGSVRASASTSRQSVPVARGAPLSDAAPPLPVDPFPSDRSDQ